VFLGKTLYSDFLSQPRSINGYLILFRIGGGKGSEGEEMGAALIMLLHISLTYDHLVMVIPLPFFTR